MFMQCICNLQVQYVSIYLYTNISTFMCILIYNCLNIILQFIVCLFKYDLNI